MKQMLGLPVTNTFAFLKRQGPSTESPPGTSGEKIQLPKSKQEQDGGQR
jgi:hypothetical protein